VAKCKIVISDLHIGRGRVLSDGSINILEDFVADRQLAEFLEFYGSGVYFDADVELILLGDVLNTIQVDYRGYFSPILTEGVSVEKVKSVIRGRPKIFEALKVFGALPNHKITYVVGNHDVDMIWDSSKAAFNEAVGVEVQFKNFSYTVDGVHYEHGQQYEAVNRLNPKKMFISKGLKEPILNLPWGSHFVINFIVPMKRQRPAIDKVRPIGAFIKWVAFNDFLWFSKTITRIFLYFFATRFSRSLYRTTNIVTTFKIFREILRPPNLVAAAENLLEQNPDVHTVIMGHTHTPKYVQFQDGREYFNSGTWTEVTSLDLLNFGKGTRYTYIHIDYSRNPTRPHGYLKEWKGRWHEDLEFYTG
jgi:UDP-2,3-diacylglucosamine pyrophosphatase LpxH